MSKSISFSVPRSLPFNFQCNPLSDAFLTSQLAAIKSSRSEVVVAQIPVVREFEDVFQDISGLPPKKRDRLLYRVGTRNFANIQDSISNGTNRDVGIEELSAIIGRFGIR